MRKLLIFSSSFFFICSSLSAHTPFVNEPSESNLYFSMDSCSAWVLAGTRKDYSEFTAVADLDPQCSHLFVLNGHLYRVNPEVNHHSCTPGINNTPAICISSDESCNYNRGDEKSLRADIVIVPGPDGSASLSEIEFYERAPEMFQYINGPSGLNNYPLFYAIRILMNGQEVYVLEDIPTHRNWTLQTFSLDTVPELTVNSTTTFNIELLGYCLVNNGGTNTAWDLDEMYIRSVCAKGNIEGGQLTTSTGATEITICAEDGQPDVVNFIVNGNTGDSSIYLITDVNNIIQYIATQPFFDFEGTGTGQFRIHHLAYEGTITGVQIGGSLADLTGCFGLSNSISVTKSIVIAGSLSTTTGMTNVSLCIPPGGSVDIFLMQTGASGMEGRYLLTDMQGQILALSANPVFSIHDSLPSPLMLWHVSWSGMLTGLVVGGNLNTLNGCFALSNPVTVLRDAVTGGNATFLSGVTDTSLCLSNGMTGPIRVKINSATGIHSQWITVDPDGNILELLGAPPFIINSTQAGICLIRHISYNEITGLSQGNNVSDLTGCFGISNSLTVNKQIIRPGFISSNGEGFIRICDKGSNDFDIPVSIVNEDAQNSKLVLIGPSNTILEIINGNIVDMDARAPGNYQIVNVAYNGSISGLIPGNTLAGLAGECIAFSNTITIVKENAIGGMISVNGSTEVNLCEFGEISAPLFIDITGQQGNFSTWLVLDQNGNIIAIKGNPPFSVDSGSGSCIIRHLSYGLTFSGLSVGQNISGFTGCFDLSNELIVNKIPVNGGLLTSDNKDSLFICKQTGENIFIPYSLVNVQGDDDVLLLTDENGTILEQINGPVVDMSLYASGSFRLVNVAFTGAITNINAGNNINSITAACFDFSNTLIIEIRSVDGGVITSPSGDDITLCKQGESGTFGSISYSVSGAIGESSVYIITDPAGKILSITDELTINVDSLNEPLCFLNHLSYSGTLLSLMTGNNINNLQGCYDLSNTISITKIVVDGGELSVGDSTLIQICIGDGLPENLNINLVENISPQSAWLLTDNSGLILEVLNDPPMDFDTMAVGTLFVYHISFSGNIVNLSPGFNLNDIQGCYDTSNEIEIVRNVIRAGKILFADSTTQKTICAGDAMADNLQVIITNNGTGTQQWVVTDINGKITSLPQGNVINFEGGPGNICYLRLINYFGAPSGLKVGSNISNVEGCYLISNILTVHKNRVIPSVISLENGVVDTLLCVGSGLDHLINVIDISGGNGNSVYILTDPDGNIIITDPIGVFNLSSSDEGVCFLVKLNFLDNITGLAVGANIDDIVGCTAFSNQIRIEKDELRVPGITYSNGEVEKSVCLNDSSKLHIDVILSNADGQGQWILTDGNGIITALLPAQPLDLSNTGPGVCMIWFVNYRGTVEFLEIGEPVLDIAGCFKISNALILNKQIFVSEDSQSSLSFDMEACNAIIITGDNADYSEFTADIDNSVACTQFSVVGGYFYRENPEVNIHSCTPGINGSTGICVSSVDGCDFPVDHERALRFDILVEPGNNNAGGIDKLSFYERAPRDYLWNDGGSGLNNYPRRYGIRVLKNGTEIYRQEDIPTSFDYTLEEFDFTAISEFKISEPTVFSFELVAYCLIANNSYVQAWDLDDIQLFSSCTSQLTGGILTDIDGNTTVDLCVEDGVFDSLRVKLLAGQGPQMSWVVTDISGTIIDIPSGPPFSFEGSSLDSCQLWSISYVNGINGFSIGANLADIEGCFDLSNPLLVRKLRQAPCESCTAEAGNISFEEGELELTICTDDGMADLTMIDHDPLNDPVFIITDSSGLILEILDEPTFDAEGLDQGSYEIRLIAYEGTITGLTAGAQIDMLSGCFDLSNALTIHAENQSQGGCGNLITYPVNEEFIISPNPVTELLTISSGLKPDKDTKVYIFNNLGRHIRTFEMLHYEMVIDLSDLPEGIYVLKIDHKNRHTARSFIKI